MPIPPISPAAPQQTTNTTSVTVPKLDGSSKDAASLDTARASSKSGITAMDDWEAPVAAKAPVDLSGGAKAQPQAQATFVDGGITASDDWETPVA
ncbi:MAG TPA: hypothetical protein VFA20_10530 [Myxococcaceae bacterium]|nr:hypothetical protein [Myxococcaceae bacterium]